jgi:hypothetical protein
MRGLRNTELLEIWERGRDKPPVVRALSLLSAACPEDVPESFRALSIGRRDALLMELREALFGENAEALLSCPRCGHQLELNFSTADLRLDLAADPGQDVTIEARGEMVRVRVPSSEDLLGAGTREQLLRRCVQNADIDRLPAEILDVIEEKIAESDPLAEICMQISCLDCNHEWREIFDIVSFLWAEIEAWVGRIVNEVHILASAYGWREQDILALSPMRRQLYLGMVQT